MSTIASRLEKQYPDTDTGLGIRVVPLSVYLAGSKRAAGIVGTLRSSSVCVADRVHQCGQPHLGSREQHEKGSLLFGRHLALAGHNSSDSCSSKALSCRWPQAVWVFALPRLESES